jgi:hypothetical protein
MPRVMTAGCALSRLLRIPKLVENAVRTARASFPGASEALMTYAVARRLAKPGTAIPTTRGSGGTIACVTGTGDTVEVVTSRFVQHFKTGRHIDS